MNDRFEIEFEARLVYARGEHIELERVVVHGSHPEIAYERALRAAEENRLGRELLGIAELTPHRGQDWLAPPGIGREVGWAPEKDGLAAFRDPRWAGVPCPPELLEEALREPALVLELDGLERVDWASLDGPHLARDLQRLAAVERRHAEVALGVVWGLVDLGEVHPATAATVTFLVALAPEPRVVVRAAIVEVLAVFAEIVVEVPGRVRSAAAERLRLLGEGEARGIEDQAAASLARVASLRAALVAEAVSLGALRDDADPDVRRHAVGIWRSLYRAGAVPEH